MTQLRPDTLWPQTLETTRAARASGALNPITTECHVIAHEGVPFQVRVLGRIHLKDEAQQRSKGPSGAPFDPFENPDPAMVVGELSPTHRCLLNKFNVVEHHLLLVTRAFEEQESPLTSEDFEALALALAGLDGLAFYNAGEMAGASQRHKHLQLIPAMGPDRLRAPMEKLLMPPPPAKGNVATVPAFGFAHAVAGLALKDLSPAEAGARLLQTYQALQAKLGLTGTQTPYNLLATRDWMLLVPRTSAEHQGINVNSMGFAGSLLVRTEEQLEQVLAMGPMALLRKVARAK
jgi:ATP adenylyltransferase